MTNLFLFLQSFFMKTLLTYTLFLHFLFITTLQAQTFESFENTKYPDTVPAIHELPNGNFIYLHTLRFPQNIPAVLAANDSAITIVKLIDPDFNLIATYPIKSYSENELFFGWDILLKENSFLIFGNIISYNSNFRQGFTIELNQDFQPISEINIFTQLGPLTGLNLPLFNHQGNLVVWGRGAQNNLYEISEEGALINSVELPNQLENYTQLSDSSYLIQYASSRFQTLSTGWDSLGEMHNYDDIIANSFLGSPGNNLLLPNGLWVGAGVLRTQESGTSAYRVEHASVFQPNGDRFTVFESDHPERPLWQTGFYGIAALSPEHIYVSNGAIADSNLNNGCDPFFYSADCTNFVSLHNFNVNGTTNWSQYLGYDAAYFPLNMVATQDSGVLFLVYRFKLEDNPSGEEGDTYFLKFDKDGNLTAPVGVEELNEIRIQRVLVYPNPAREVLRYQYQLPSYRQLTIQLFDAAGRLVLTDGLEDRETTIDHLAAGAYFYQIYGDKEPIQSGKIIVK